MASTFISLPLTSVTGPVDVVISATNDSIRISDGSDILSVNSDGSINVVTSGTVSPIGDNQYEYDEVSNVAIGGSATIVSKLFATPHKLRRISATGNNVAIYTVFFNGTAIDKKHSTYGNFNCQFDYETGIIIPAATTVSVQVENLSANSPGDFSAQLLFSLE